MLQNFWKCFETTGDISHYLSFKDYEKTYYNSVTEHTATQSMPVDGMNEE